jgi:hypothetical protein
LAGGLNLYGFANGDPINFSDPYGLCVEDACVLEVVGAVSLAPLVKAAFVASAVAVGTYVGAHWSDVTTFFRKSSKAIRREWEKLHGEPWPKTETGENYEGDHDVPIADGGATGAENVTPRPHDEHVQRHKDRGDFKRWGKRAAPKGADEPKEPEPDERR